MKYATEIYHKDDMVSKNVVQAKSPAQALNATLQEHGLRDQRLLIHIVNEEGSLFTYKVRPHPSKPIYEDKKTRSEDKAMTRQQARNIIRGKQRIQ